MKKLLNDPERFVDEMVEGILLAHGDCLRAVGESGRALVRADAPLQGKVAIVTGGGSGHLPVFLGYVGRGLADGVAVGNIFASPSSEAMYEATRAVHGGAGVLYLFGNYTGDRLNFEMTEEMARAEGIETATVIVSDDVASAPPDRWQDRRGVAGLFYAYKIAGACAETGAPLEEVRRVAAETVQRTRSMGVALGPCVLPTTGKPTFTIGEDEMEIGMGIHGEAGIERGALRPADEVSEDVTRRILADMPMPEGSEVSVLINGLGATPLEELYIVYRGVQRVLIEAGLRIHRPYIGEYATSLDMAGCSITLLHLTDALKGYLDAPARSPFFEQGGVLRCRDR